MEVVELSNLISPCKSDSNSQAANTPVPKTKGTRRKQTLNLSSTSLKVKISDDDGLDSSIEVIQENYKRMKLESYKNSFISLLSEEAYPPPPSKPESPSSQSGSVVEGQGTNSSDYYEEESVIDTGLAAKEDSNKENHSPYFITPPGPLKQLEIRVNSSLNDLISPQVSLSPRRSQREVIQQVYRQLSPARQPFTRQFRPMTVALSQSAPGVACSCRRIQFGRGHGCLMSSKYCWN